MPESSPAACRFAIRDKTDFCALLTGLLNMDSALTFISFAGRDDAYGFFVVIFILHAIDVDDQQHRGGRGSNGVPPLFARHDAVLAKNCVRIVENERGGVEREAVVLLLVDPALFTIPLKPHRYTKCITQSMEQSTRQGAENPLMSTQVSGIREMSH